MSAATNGRAREYLVRNDLARHGWRQVMRSAGSKGAADLFMVHATHGGALVQVGTPNKTVGPAARARFIADATDTGSLAVLAIVVPSVGVRYRIVTGGMPRTWDEWAP